MYKEVIISIVVIIFVLIIDNISQGYTDKTIEKIDEDLSNVREMIVFNVENNENKNEDKIKKQVDKIVEEWEEKYYVLAIYIEHDELVVLKSNVEFQEYKTAITDIDRGRFSLEHLKEKEVLNLDNFF